MKTNKSFAKTTLLQDGTPDYAPSVIRVPTHHHEEWDEPVLDPDTGEPTGETEHKTRDWDTYRTEIKPTTADYHAAGYLDVVTSMPSTPAPSGYHYEPAGWEVSDNAVRRVWNIVEDPPAPPPPPRRWTRLSIKTALAGRGMIDAARQYLSAVELAPGYPALEAFTDCDYIEEGYPDAEKWEAILNGAAQALGKTREEIDAFLDSVPVEK